MRDFVFPCLFVSDRIFCCRMVEHTQGHKGDGTLRRSDVSVHEQCMWMWFVGCFSPTATHCESTIERPLAADSRRSHRGDMGTCLQGRERKEEDRNEERDE